MTSPMQGVPHWQVTAQQETNRTDQGGRFVSGVLVSYSADNGATGSVFVPDSQYNPDNVKRLIAERVGQHSNILGLKG